MRRRAGGTFERAERSPVRVSLQGGQPDSCVVEVMIGDGNNNMYTVYQQQNVWNQLAAMGALALVQFARAGTV